MNRDTLMAEIALWLDPTVIGEAIVDGLEQQERPMTVEEAKRVWLGVLESELHDAIRRVARVS